MGDCESIIPTYDAEQHVLAAALHLVKALGVSNNMNDDMRKILAEFETHFSAMTKLTKSNTRLIGEAENRLKHAQEKVMAQQSNQLMIWDSGPKEASEYLQAVDEVRRLAESLGSTLSNNNEKQKELHDRAHSVLQVAMAKLEEELMHILAWNKRFFGPRCMSFHCSAEGVVFDESIVSTEDDSIEDIGRRESSGTESEEYIMDSVHPGVVSDIKSIATVMFASNYDQEFCQAFTNFWRDALDEYLIIICKMDKLSIEEVLKMEWSSLNRKIRKWCRAMKSIIGFYLAGMKWLFNQVLGEFGSVCSICFIEASKASMLCLLDFGEAIAIGPHLPERLFCLINMYEVLADLLQDIDVLFLEEASYSIRIEFHELQRKLGDSARVTFVEFGNQVASNTSTTPFPKGGIHPLTKYVMNYMRTLAGYSDTLNLLLEGQDKEDLDPVVDAEDGQNALSYTVGPMAHHLQSVTSILEANLDNKSKLYRDGSLVHIFMMNNIHYMVEKVRGSELKTYFGGEWIREHIGKFQQHATSYERATWSSVLSLLMADGSPDTAILREKCRSFTFAFEEAYRSQTGWHISDPQLREDLQISISQKVIHAYRTFLGRYSTSISDKYIKYTADDLENYILDLFQGSPRTLHNARRR